jgi:hypothetical protein
MGRRRNITAGILPPLSTRHSRDSYLIYTNLFISSFIFTLFSIISPYSLPLVENGPMAKKPPSLGSEEVSLFLGTRDTSNLPGKTLFVSVCVPICEA